MYCYIFEILKYFVNEKLQCILMSCLVENVKCITIRTIIFCKILKNIDKAKLVIMIYILNNYWAYMQSDFYCDKWNLH